MQDKIGIDTLIAIAEEELAKIDAKRERLLKQIETLKRKKEVTTYDYVDPGGPVLAKMFKKRIQGYKAIGYEIMNKGSGIEQIL